MDETGGEKDNYGRRNSQYKTKKNFYCIDNCFDICRNNCLFNMAGTSFRVFHIPICKWIRGSIKHYQSYYIKKKGDGMTLDKA